MTNDFDRVLTETNAILKVDFHSNSIFIYCFSYE